MSSSNDSIQYQFDPDPQTRSLCESVARKLQGNGVRLSDIVAESVTSGEVRYLSQFLWQIDIKISSRLLSGKQTAHS